MGDPRNHIHRLTPNRRRSRASAPGCGSEGSAADSGGAAVRDVSGLGVAALAR